ncbi:hypothetical protein AX16_004109 [Volvariella volvacea WC 439]|nr:hypothetical protein AX16_004109 [Volvariella volvacea WC 439]
MQSPALPQLPQSPTCPARHSRHPQDPQHSHTTCAPSTSLVAGQIRRHTYPAAYGDAEHSYAHPAYPILSAVMFDAQPYSQKATPVQYYPHAASSEPAPLQQYTCNDQTLSAYSEHPYYVDSTNALQESPQNQFHPWDFPSGSSSSSTPVAALSGAFLLGGGPQAYHPIAQDQPRYTQALTQAPALLQEQYPYPHNSPDYQNHPDPDLASGSEQRQRQEQSDNQKDNDQNDADSHHSPGSAFPLSPHGSICSSPTPATSPTSSSSAIFELPISRSPISTSTATPIHQTMIASPHSPHHLHHHHFDSQPMAQSVHPHHQSSYSGLPVNVPFPNSLSHYNSNSQPVFEPLEVYPPFTEPCQPHIPPFSPVLSSTPSPSSLHFTHHSYTQNSPTHMTSSLMHDLVLDPSPAPSAVAPTPRYPHPHHLIQNQYPPDGAGSPRMPLPHVTSVRNGTHLNGNGIHLGLDTRFASGAVQGPASSSAVSAGATASTMTTAPLVSPISSSGRRHQLHSIPVSLNHGISGSTSVPRLSQRGNLGPLRPARRSSAPAGHTMALPLGPNTTGSTGEGKKQTLACLFCRERKIACGRPAEGSLDPTCNQCARRSLRCEYPTESRRGQHKRTKKKQAAAAAGAASGSQS